MYQSIIASGKKRSYRANRNKETVYPDDDQCFAVVKEMMGNGRLNALCDDGVVRLGRIRGSMRSGPRKAIVSKGDLILVSARDFEDKVDVIHRYSHDEATMMFRRYKMPEYMVRAWNMDDMNARDKETDEVVFMDEDDNGPESLDINGI